MPRWKSRSAADEQDRDRDDGRAEDLDDGTSRTCAQQKSGSASSVMPGARIVWIVTMKFRPVRIDEKPEMKMPTAVTTTQPFE